MAVETECLADLLQLSLSEQQKSRAILPVVWLAVQGLWEPSRTTEFIMCAFELAQYIVF